MDASKGKRKHRGYLPWTEDMDQVLLDVLLKHYQNDDYTPTGWKSHYLYESRPIILAMDYEPVGFLIPSKFRMCEYLVNNIAVLVKGLASRQHVILRDLHIALLAYNVSTGAEDAQETALKDAEDVHGSTPNSPSTSEHSSEYRGGPPPSTQEKQQCRRTKRFRANDTLFCMSGTINNSFQISIKSNEPLDEPRNACPEKIFAALQEIPNLGRDDLLRAYCILTDSDRKFESLMALPMDMRKDWLWMEIGKK
uniref:Myb/SANT-like domain-containing protein n=1 Tax=Oryza punctata TaxID=4537 RepID=A0A0E0LLY7_ORYPU